MRTWYSRQSRHVANIGSTCHCCTHYLQITQVDNPRGDDRYHETLEAFGHVLALGTVQTYILRIIYGETREVVDINEKGIHPSQ